MASNKYAMTRPSRNPSSHRTTRVLGGSSSDSANATLNSDSYPDASLLRSSATMLAASARSFKSILPLAEVLQVSLYPNVTYCDTCNKLAPPVRRTAPSDSNDRESLQPIQEEKNSTIFISHSTFENFCADHHIDSRNCFLSFFFFVLVNPCITPSHVVPDEFTRGTSVDLLPSLS